MRWYVSIGAVLLAGAIAGGVVAGIAAPNPKNQRLDTTRLAQAKDDKASVDVELILAVDVSYFEWAASSDQKIIIPWRLIDGPETADAVANEIMKTPIRRASRTSISGAISFAMPLFDEDPYHGPRHVIDISGDGPNNNGVPVVPVRDAALAKGIVINGLPIMVKEPSYSTMDIDNLDWYYEDCVIGGPGSFVVSIKDREKFKEPIRTKLLLEVAGRTPERRVVPAAAKEPRVSCLIGEKIWQDRWGR